MSSVGTRFVAGLAAVALLVMVSVAALAVSADWPQWHGPNHDSIVPGDQPKVAVWAAKGPLKVWDSPPIPSAGEGGLGSVVVAGDRVYMFGTPKFTDKLTERTLGNGELDRLGVSATKIPADLCKVVEPARVSDERAKLKDKPLNDWVKAFDDANLTTKELKDKYTGIVNDRIYRGKNAMALEVLTQLETVRNKPFADQAALDKWLDDNAITGDVRKAVVGVIATTKDRMEDTLYCLNATDGTLVWKKNYPGRVDGWGYSCTPCVADGQVFAVGSLGTVYCLNAKDGAEVWTAKAGASHSSFIVVDGLAIVQAGPLTAYQPATGKVVWTQPKVNTGTNSPTPWAKDGKSLLLCNTGRGAVSCVEVKTGNVLWTAPGGSDSTAAVSGDMMVVLTGNNLLGYRITAEKAEKVWELPGGDRGASPLIYKGNAYVVNNGQVRCVSLADGKLLWSGKGNFREYTSPLVVDGKLVVVGDNMLSLVDTATDKFNLLVAVPFDVSDVTTPAFANGKMYIRLHKSVSCFDVSQSAPVPAPTPKGK